MGSTSNYSWQYPALTDPPNVPQHMQILADAADATVKNLDTRLSEAETKIINMGWPPHATLTVESGQSIPNNVPTFVRWDHSYADSADGHDENVNNTRYTAQRAGRYLAVVTLAGTLTHGGQIQFLFCRNGIPIAWAAALNSNPGQFALSGVHMPWLGLNQYLEIQVYQTTTQEMALYPYTNDNGGCSLEITWLGGT